MKTIPLDPNAPMASLREAAGLSKAEMARVRRVRPPTVNYSEDAGGGVRVETLVKAAAALGFELRLTVVKKDEPR